MFNWSNKKPTPNYDVIIARLLKTKEDFEVNILEQNACLKLVEDKIEYFLNKQKEKPNTVTNTTCTTMTDGLETAR